MTATTAQRLTCVRAMETVREPMQTESPATITIFALSTTSGTKKKKFHLSDSDSFVYSTGGTCAGTAISCSGLIPPADPACAQSVAGECSRSTGTCVHNLKSDES